MRTEVDHNEIQELLGAYALHAVEGDEAAAIEAHIAWCPECRDELAQHLEVASMLSATERFAPTELWDTIVRQIPTTPGEETFPNPRDDTPAPSGRADAAVVPLRRRWLRPLAAAAAIVVIAGTAAVQSVRLNAVTADLAAEQALVAALRNELEKPPLDLAVAQALAGSENRQLMLGSQVSGSNAVIVLMPDGTGYLAEHTLRPLPADRTYQLWAIIDGKIISAGILGPDPGIVPFRIDPEGFSGFAITEEVVGGVESSQNDPVIAWLEA